MAATKKSSARKSGASGKRKYSKSASKTVASAVRRAKRGTLKSGAGSHGKVKSRKQAIAIGLSEARKQGQNGPPRRRRRERNARRRTSNHVATRPRVPRGNAL